MYRTAINYYINGKEKAKLDYSGQGRLGKTWIMKEFEQGI